MQYTVVKQKRKTATIVISDDLEVLVKVPKYVTKDQIAQLVQKNEKWIMDTLDKKKKVQEENDWCVTGKMLYLGSFWPVKSIINKQMKPIVIFDGDCFKVVSDGTEEVMRLEMEKFFRRRANEKLTELATYYADLLGVSYQKITIRKQVTRWGSCSSKGNLSFNLKILCAPMEMVSYVVLHEVTHLKHFDHSKNFWQEVEKHMPDYKKRMNYFKQFGQNFII